MTLDYLTGKKYLEKEILEYESTSKIEINKTTPLFQGDTEQIEIKFDLNISVNVEDIIKDLNTYNSNLTLEKSLTSDLKFKNDELSISFGSFLSSGKYISVVKNKLDFSDIQLEGLINTYKIANPLVINKKDPIEELTNLGASVYQSNKGFNWDMMAGYDSIKREIKNTIILPFENPQLYQNLVLNTRKIIEDIKPNAVLFEGKSGTGKTLSAKIITNSCSKPLVYVPVESILSKWYGESEQNLSKIFDASNELEALIFIDEIDSLATSRENKTKSEASSRVLGTLLRKIDGFDSKSDSILIGATNRKKDLDPALISRFDTCICFELPDEKSREEIYSRYAKQLSDKELSQLVLKSENLSGRNIKDICEHAERSHISKILNSEISRDNLTPSIDEYLNSLKVKIKSNN